jgi:hypothetical protein
MSKTGSLYLKPDLHAIRETSWTKKEAIVFADAYELKDGSLSLVEYAPR